MTCNAASYPSQARILNCRALVSLVSTVNTYQVPGLDTSTYLGVLAFTPSCLARSTNRLAAIASYSARATWLTSHNAQLSRLADAGLGCHFRVDERKNVGEFSFVLTLVAFRSWPSDPASICYTFSSIALDDF